MDNPKTQVPPSHLAALTFSSLSLSAVFSKLARTFLPFLLFEPVKLINDDLQLASSKSFLNWGFLPDSGLHRLYTVKTEVRPNFSTFPRFRHVVTRFRAVPE